MAELIPVYEDQNKYIRQLETELVELNAKNDRMEILSSFSELILDSANIWMEMFDEEGSILLWNRAAEKISGYSRDEVLYDNSIWYELFQNWDTVRELFLYLKKTEGADVQKNLEKEITCKDGTQKWLVWNFIQQQGQDDKKSFICFGNDITDRKKTEEEKAELQKQLMISEKSQALVRVAKGMTHEIANPIAVLKNDLDLLWHYVSEYCGNSFPCPVDKIKPIISRDWKAVKRVAGIISAFKSTYRPENWHYINPNKEIEIQLTLLKMELTSNISIKKSLSSVSEIHCYGNEIGQIILNLLSNAAEAIEGEGVIEIHTWEDSGKFFLKITDSGKGIPAEILPRIFELYFTTKSTGSGLGLAMSQQMAVRHGGRIYLEESFSQKQGSSFVLEIPKKSRGGKNEEI